MNGFYNKRDYVLLTMIVLFTITLSTFFVINANFIYWLVIKYLNLNIKYHVSTQLLMHNLHVMVTFIQNPLVNAMHLWHYKLSNGAYEHFTDVRKLVMLDYLILALSGFYLLICAYHKTMQTHLWKLTDYLKRVMLVIGLLMFICLIDFYDVFIYLHRMIFPNHNWVFSPKKDPIIEVLPDQYFLSCFVVWFGLVFLLLISFYLAGKWQIKKKEH
ncbi:TIGR01906 family membrane protein [Fructilactobacillus sp. Tb1]|uniref:TIGR01906 family membrane protein n=1 Tax=Fructilactobacillus sp. Tb1 TaxID=3422304 RepID=UPI003D282F1F